MLDFNDDDDDVIIHKGTLSSIFRRNQRHFVLRDRLSKLNATTATAAPVKEEKDSQINNDDVILKSKLSWLTHNDADSRKERLSAAFTNDYPVLSAKKPCPKIRDGFKCSKIDCQFYHPENDEIKKIVSDMKSLKKRVVKDVLTIIHHDDSSSKTKKETKSKMCKFLEKCKFKTTTCKYAHSEEELIIGPCQFAAKCRFVKFSDKDGKYCNHNGGKCLFLHPRETKSMFMVRNQSK
jgi:hypothetical protein